MKKILIFGARGMLGHVALDYLNKTGCYQVIPCVRKAQTENEISADITDFCKVQKIIEEQKPDFILNCIGMLVKACSDHPDQAILVNSYFPQFLAVLGRKYGCKLIHISTDCVFSGKKGNYKDTDFRDGDTPYARTKALGEVIDDHNLTIRTSIIGPELKANGTGLFYWFMQQTGEIKGYTRAYWSGVTTLELAKCIHAAIQQGVTGLYQLSMPEKISKYDLLNLIQKIWQKNDVKIMPFDGYFCDKSMLNTLLNDSIYCLPESYCEMLEQLHTYMQK